MLKLMQIVFRWINKDAFGIIQSALLSLVNIEVHISALVLFSAGHMGQSCISDTLRGAALH